MTPPPHTTETLPVMLAAVFAAIVGLLTGLIQTATEIGRQAKASAVEAVETAHKIQMLTELSEVSVLGYSLCGGIVGGLAGWALRIIPKEGVEAARAVFGSAAAAFIFGPWTLGQVQYPPTLTNVLFVTGSIGLGAWIVVVKILPKLVPVLVNAAPAWMLKLLGLRPTDLDPARYDVEDNRARAEIERERETKP